MQFAHPRLLITSSLPLRFPSLSRRFSGFRFSVLPLVFRFSAVSLFFAGFPFFLRFSVFPPFPRRFSVLLRFSVSPPFLRSSTGFPFFRRFPAVSPFPRRFSVSPPVSPFLRSSPVPLPFRAIAGSVHRRREKPRKPGRREMREMWWREMRRPA